MSITIDFEDSCTQAETLEVIKELGPPYFVGSNLKLPPGKKIVISEHPFVIVREVPEQLLMDVYVPRAMDRGDYEIVYNRHFDYYYELSTD